MGESDRNKLNRASRKRILFIISSLYGGGAERVCCLLASKFAEKYDVMIVYRGASENRYPIDPRVKLREMYVKESGPGHPWEKVLRPFRKVIFCRRIKKEFEPDVSISFLFHYNLWNVLSGGNCRIVCSERCNPRKTKGGKHFPATRWLYRKADIVVFQSQQVMDLYSRKVRDHSAVIQNPVNVCFKAKDQRSHRIVNMGRLVDQKNQSMLIKSFAEFHRQFPDHTLTIYGEGPLMDDLKNLACDLGVGDCVFFPGNVSDIHLHIDDAEMFVLSSDYEGLSNALLECMSMGIACISTECEGSVDVIDDGKNGLLIPVGDGSALTHAMIRLASDSGLRRRIEANAAESMLSLAPDVICAKWEALIFDEPTAGSNTSVYNTGRDEPIDLTESFMEE